MKTKDKTKFVLFFVLFLVLALGIGYGIYYLADVVFNGSVLEWFAENYFYIETKRIDGKNGPVYYFRPDWPKLKMLVLTIFFSSYGYFRCVYLSDGTFSRQKSGAEIHLKDQPHAADLYAQ